MIRPNGPSPRSPGDPLAGVAALYRGYAVALLAVALLLGVWMRAMVVWPRVAAPIPFQHLVHAHSHVGFFGWLVLGIAAAVIPSAGSAARVAALRRIGHAVAAASIAALIAFAWQGYGAASIAVSVVHVALWVALVRELWALPRADRNVRPWLRVALAGLGAAGASTLLPGILTARGVESGWLRDFGIELFLDLFIFGWAIAASIGIAYSLVAPARSSRVARILFAIGVAPSACLYVAAPPGQPFVWLGRIGTALVGTALLLVARDLLARPRDALTALASVALALVGALQVTAAAGVGSALLHGRPIVLAFVHLALVGVATPTLLASAPGARRVARTAGVGLLAGGLALMLLTLVAMGWPWLSTLASSLGIDVMELMALACVGGACAAAGVLALALLPRARAATSAIPLLSAEAPLP